MSNCIGCGKDISDLVYKIGDDVIAQKTGTDWILAPYCRMCIGERTINLERFDPDG